MAIGDIPVFREAQRGQVVRSDDWNGIQRELRNGIRAHRHTRVAGAPADDAAPADLALQITTNEIADGAVTAAKLSPDVLGDLPVAIQRGADVGVPLEVAGPGAARQATTDVVSLAPRARERIKHGLGTVPVAVALGIRGNVPGLDGEFEIYGAPPDQGKVFAAVPPEPDGTFVLVSTARSEVAVRWWAVSVARDAAPTETAKPARRRGGR
jgi:hypothetical protein